MRSFDDLSLEQQQAYTVAYLLAKQDLGQSHVGELLRLSQATVSRRVRLAKQMGVLQETPRFSAPRSALTKHLQEQWGRPFAAYETKLQERYGKKLRGVRVFRSRATIDGRDDWDRAVVAFGKAAARHVLNLVCQSEAVGIAYGRTLKVIAWGLRDLLRQIPANRPKARFFPLWGSLHGSPGRDVADPNIGRIFTKPDEISSDFMAKELNKLLHPSPPDYSLETVPSFLPPGFFADDQEETPARGSAVPSKDDQRKQPILDLFQHPKMSAHAGIFGRGTTKGDIDQNCTLFVTASSPKDSPIGRFYHARLMAWLDLDERQLSEHFLGDLGSVLIGKGARGEDLARKLDRLSLCLRYDHLAACAQRARDFGHPGVVAFAVGKTRATMLHESIRQGLVNEVVIDQHCAAALCRL